MDLARNQGEKQNGNFEYAENTQIREGKVRDNLFSNMYSISNCDNVCDYVKVQYALENNYEGGTDVEFSLVLSFVFPDVLTESGSHHQ